MCRMPLAFLKEALANDQTDMEDLLKQLLTLSGGTGLTNMTRPKDEELKAYKEATTRPKWVCGSVARGWYPT